jgi:CheY-like chemotaxis protein
LLALINEVLDLARIEAGKIALSVEPVLVASVVGECLPLIQNSAREMNVEIQSLPAGTVLNVMADYIRLKQVLLNLLSNAVKYNRKGGKVAISARVDATDRVRISVSDTGLGIPESQQRNLFRPFQRLVAESSVIEGTGIGLALTKNLVIAMGGEVGFESVPGTGSTFWVEFPLASDAGVSASLARTKKPAAEIENRVKGCVLYVEDNPANVMLMEYIASRMSIQFMTAHNAELGIALAASQLPDLIIMDINLPQMDGYEALKCLKQNPVTASIPVMALSANAMPNDVERGLAAGFVRYHTKPIDVEEMVASIGEMLKVQA